jgi:bisanhydrobacterioruberin hydratase
MSRVRRSFAKELIWIYVVGLVGMVIPYTRPVFQAITPINLWVVTGLLLYNHSQWNVRTVAAMAVVGVVSFFIEALGVNTGLIFGEYSYGPTLGPALLNTPLMIGVNWILLVYVTHSIAGEILAKFSRGEERVEGTVYGGGRVVVVALLGALLMTGYDIVLEPAAIRLDMWEWAAVSVPLQNYLAWFMLAFVFILLFGFAGVDTRNPTSRPVFLIQLIFFLLLNIWFVIEGRLF